MSDGRRRVGERNLWVVDTEDDSKGNLYHVVFYDGETYQTFTSAEAAVLWLESQKEKALCFAVNLEYDVLNLFRDGYSRLRWQFGRSKLISVGFKRWLFYDSLNHFKISVEGMGKYVEAKKLPFDPQSLDYCKADCRTTYQFISRMVDLYKRIGFKKMKSTLPSTVYAFWLKKYSPFYLPRLSEATLDDYRPAYYGGRVDCFFVGKVQGPVRVVDVNSLFPFVMQREYPSPYQAERRFSLESFGITTAQVEVRQDVPVLPYRTKTGKLIYPNGRFSGTWVNDELLYAVRRGGCRIVKVLDSTTFPVRCVPFRSFVRDFYRRRTSTSDPFMRDLYKLAMNALYGKFGQGREKTNVMPKSEWLKGKKLNTDKIYIYGDLVIYVTQDRYPVNTNMVWAAYTTAFARLYLHEWLTKIKAAGGRLLYCDTDSVFYLHPKPLVPVGEKLGAFKDEGVYTEADIRLPKMYRLSSGARVVVKAKGVGKKYQEAFFENGEVLVKRPVKFRESLRRNLTPNFWMDTPKTNHLKYDKGEVLKDGTVRPFTLAVGG